MVTKKTGTSQIVERKPIDVVDLLLDTDNFRIGHQDSQKAARESVITEQGKKLIALALDIVTHGFSPYDLPFVYPAPGKSDEYVMLEGNRRLLTLKLLLEPEQCKGTVIYEGIKKLNTKHAARLPTNLFCAVAPDRKSGLLWVARKHAKSMDGAGTEDWGAIARERFDAEMGIPTPNLDTLDYVRTHAVIDRDVADLIDKAKFPISTLGRVLGDDQVKQRLGLTVEAGKLKCDSDPNWLTKVLAEMVSAIALAKFNGGKFNVRSVDDQDGRIAFANQLLEKYPKGKKAAKPWIVDKNAPAVGSQPAVKTTIRTTQSTSSKDRKCLIPRDFKLKIPEGKVNDVYHELKTLDVKKYANAAGILMRVFLEFSVDRFMKEYGVKLRANAKDSLLNKITACVLYCSTENLMTSKELKAINTELANRHSFISPETLNAYVHDPVFSADSDQLKVTWNRLQPFVAILWSNKK